MTEGPSSCHPKLYFTGDAGDKPVIDVAVDQTDVEQLLSEFDQTVGSIEACKFSELAQDEAECSSCPFSGYCNRS